MKLNYNIIFLLNILTLSPPLLVSTITSLDFLTSWNDLTSLTNKYIKNPVLKSETKISFKILVKIICLLNNDN